MKTLNSAVIHKPTFAKMAGVKLPKNSMDWNEIILKQFYSELPYLPTEYSVDAVINTIDDKAGYAKGSVVVWNGGRKINFPVIIKDWELSPFDTFVQDDPSSSESVYRSATEENIQKAMYDERFGEPDTLPGAYPSTDDIKRPGHITPKSAVLRTSPTGDDGYLSFDKVSFDWKASVNDADFEKFAEELRVSPGVRYAFHENNPDLLTTVIDEINSKRTVPKLHDRGIRDVRHFVKRKQMDTVTDAEMFDVNMLRPVKAPAITELRLSYFPTLEDFMTSGNSIIGRYSKAANGKPIKGLVIDVRDLDGNESSRVEQLFISKCGSCYARKSTYSNTPIFYGMEKPHTADEFDKCVRKIDANTSDTMTTYNSGGQKYPAGLDKVFPKAQDSIDYYKRKQTSMDTNISCPRLALIYGADNAWEAIVEHGPFTKRMVEGREIYVGRDVAIVKANVANPVYTKTTTDPVYRAAVGDKRILLIPEFTIVINLGLLEDITDKLLTPSRKIKDTFDKAEIAKVAVQVGKNGYRITGEAIDPLVKIASLEPFHEFSTDEAVTALYTMGMDKAAAQATLGTLVKQAADGGTNRIEVYGVSGDYIDLTPYEDMQKEANVKKWLGKYAEELKVNLIKEASVVEDPEAVDSVLSLNFINEDNILEYAEYTDELRETSDKLSELLVANRMGLKDVDESALKKSVDGIETVIQGLNKLKMIVGTR